MMLIIILLLIISVGLNVASYILGMFESRANEDIEIIGMREGLRV